MKKHFKILLALSLVLLTVQEPVLAGSKIWSYTFSSNSPNNESALAIVQTNDAGYAILFSKQNLGNFSLIKMDPSGQLEWNQTLNLQRSDNLGSLICTSDGGFALAGYRDYSTYDKVNSPDSNGYDFLIIRTDKLGNVEWNKTYGGNLNDSANSLIETSDGGYALAGYTESFEPNGWWVVKTDKFGNLEWNQTYGGDSICQIIQTSDSGFALFGTSTPGNCRLLKTNADGAMEWEKNISTESHLSDAPCSIVECSDSSLALAGYAYTDYLYPVSSWLIKTDANGKQEWVQHYEEEKINSMIEIKEGFALAGNIIHQSVFLVTADSVGDILWNKTFGGFDYYSAANSLVYTLDRGFALACYGENDAYGSDAWVIKTDENGYAPQYPTSALQFSSNPKNNGFDFYQILVVVFSIIIILFSVLSYFKYHKKAKNIPNKI